MAAVLLEIDAIAKNNKTKKEEGKRFFPFILRGL